MFHEPNPHLREPQDRDFVTCQFCAESFNRYWDGIDKLDFKCCAACEKHLYPLCGEFTPGDVPCVECVAELEARVPTLDPHDPQTRSDRWG